jgi:hypothetical protein
MERWWWALAVLWKWCGSEPPRDKEDVGVWACDRDDASWSSAMHSMTSRARSHASGGACRPPPAATLFVLIRSYSCEIERRKKEKIIIL